MREILFRGKRKDNGEWVQGDFAHPCNIVIEEIGYDEVLKQKNVTIINDYEVDPETVGQFTGILDRNGRKIFEGDKVKFVHTDYDWVYAVEYYGNRAEYILRALTDGNNLSLHCFASTELEVVGNVADDGGAE